eukprot:Gb_11621 [translate_table: standard]
MEIVPGCWSQFGLGSGIPLLKLSVEDLGEPKLPGVAGNAWNGEPGRSIVIGSSFIWGKFIFLAIGRPGDCMEMLLECLRNPGHRLGIVTVRVFVTVCGCCLMLLRGFEGVHVSKMPRVWWFTEKHLGRLERPPLDLGNGEQYAEDCRNSRWATDVLTAVVVVVVGNFEPLNNEQCEDMVKGGQMTKVITVAGFARREPNRRGESIDGGRWT